MNKRTLNKYLNGWKAVAKLEAEELQRTPLRVKFKQVLAISKLGIGLGVGEKRTIDKQTTKVRARWCLLKAGH